MSASQSPWLPGKAAANDFLGRFREIVSDPLNLLIERHPAAGTIQQDMLCLHNGLRVPASGDDAYYGRFSDILVINRGVHEPLEEFVFQTLLGRLRESPVMLELGAYWGHYSMWLKQRRPAAQTHLIEPDEARLEVGRRNFARNRMEGVFSLAFVGRGQFEIDEYLRATGIGRLDILHADIQGYEAEMIEGAYRSLSERAVDWVFVSTHSQRLHEDVAQALSGLGYRIEVTSDFDGETTSFDGFVFASSPEIAPLLPRFRPMARTTIVQSSAAELAAFVAENATTRSQSSPSDA